MKLLVALTRFPWPIEKGDKLRAYYQLKGLAQRHEVHLVCLNDREVSPEHLAQLDFCKSVQVIRHGKWKAALNVLGTFFNSRPFQVNYFHSRPMKKAVRETIRREKIEVCYVQLIRLGSNLPFEENIGWFLDYMDAFSIGMETRSKQSGPLMRPFAGMEARRLSRYEAFLADKFQGYSIISDRDASALPPAVRKQIVIIPNGVGEDFFEDLPQPEQPDFDLIFFGNMGYHPNVQSARYLMEEVVPAIRALGLQPKICLAGARPAPVVRAYAGKDVEVTGFVDDIRVWVRRSRLAIAPLVAGQGLQNKLLESMAMGIPTLTTPLANSALHAENGKEIIVCDTPQAFAEAVRELLADPVRAQEIGANGRAFVENNFRWEVMNRKLEEGLLACKRK